MSIQRTVSINDNSSKFSEIQLQTKMNEETLHRVQSDLPRPMFFQPVQNHFTPSLFHPGTPFILPSIKGPIPQDLFGNMKTPIAKASGPPKEKPKRRVRISKRNPSMSLCANCNTDFSPLWRKGQDAKDLCNKCGLYWFRHGFNRPPTLERVKRTNLNGNSRNKPAAKKIGPREGVYETTVDFSDTFQKQFRFYPQPEPTKDGKFLDLMFGKESEPKNEPTLTNQFILEESEEDLTKRDPKVAQPSLWYHDHIFPLTNAPENWSNSPNAQKQEYDFDKEFDMLDDPEVQEIARDLAFSESEPIKQDMPVPKPQ
jgi:hypothetical protein